MQLAFAAQMRELDRVTMAETGIPGMVLMENAGRASVEQMREHLGPVQGKVVCIFVGSGNNGGDGLVVARALHGLGGFPYMLFLCDPAGLRGDAGQNFCICKKLGLPFQVLQVMEQPEDLARHIFCFQQGRPLHSLVDAIFGTGLARPVEGRFRAIIEAVNQLRLRHGWPVVSLDVPSGLDSDTGAVLGAVVQADLTVTYALAKAGLLHHGGPCVGRLACVDIGIPPENVTRADLRGLALDQQWAKATLRPRAVEAHKGGSGHLLVMAGSTGKTGAALLCAQGALRGGAGLVTMAAAKELQPVFAASLAEAMSAPLQHGQRFFTLADYEQIRTLMEGKQALVIGPGLGLHPDSAELLFRLYQEERAPQVIDADALTLLAGRPEVIRRPGGPRIFTPHPGEMARLLGCSVAEVQKDRLRPARWLADDAVAEAPELVTVLKGAGTVVASTRGQWAINTSGNSGMATGGMGDVLAGMIGALLAQGYAPWEAACLGVYLHGRAADQLAQTRPWGYMASEVAQELPLVLGDFF